MRSSRQEHVRGQRRLLQLEPLEKRLLLSGATIYVDDDFTSGTPGWGVDHFDQIQDGINAAGAADTVMVAAGTYNENITIGSGHDGLTLQGAGAAVTIIDGGASDTVIDLNNFDGGTISGFTIRNGSASEGGGINCDSSDSTITSCIITGNAADLNGGGVYVSGGSPTIINNVVTDNTAYFGAGFYMNAASPTFANNTIYGNTAGSCGGALYGTESVFTMVNCILWNNQSSPMFPNDEIMLRSDADLTIRYSIIMDGDDEIFAWMGAEYSYDSTNSDSNPQFVAAGSGDFNLQASSPAIDAADGDTAPASDFAGNVRIDDPLTANTGVGTPDYADIGAFEFVGVVGNDPPTIASLQDSPDPVTRPDNLTLTALGVDDPDGAATVTAVEFYRDANGNGTLEPGTDVLLGTDTNGADGWSWTGSTAGWPAGSPHTYLARARDGYSAYSDAVSTTGTVLNAAPTIDSLTDWVAGGNVTLTAQGVSDEDAVSKVEFYLDQNADGVLQVGTDTYLGDGTQDGADWDLVVDVSGWADGTYTFFARAQDNDSAWSSAVSTEAEIGQRYVGRISDPYSGAYVDVYAHEDITLANIVVAFSGGAPSSVQLKGEDAMYGLGLVIHSEPGSLVACSIKDGRKNVTSDVFFIASDAPIKSIQLKGGMAGWDLNGLTLGDIAFAADIDGDGDTSDLTAVYCEGPVQKLKMDRTVSGDIWIGAADYKGVALKSFQTKYGGYHGDLVAAGHVEKVSLGGDFASSISVAGYLKSFQIKGGDLKGTIDVSSWVGKISVSGKNGGGSITDTAAITVNGMDSKGLSLKSLQTKGGGFHGSLAATWAVGKVSAGGDLGATIDVGGSLKSLQVKGGDFSGDVVVGADLGKLDVKGDKTGGGVLLAGAQVSVGGLLNGCRATSYETENGGGQFGITAGSYGKIRLGDVQLLPTDLPFADGDFSVAVS